MKILRGFYIETELAERLKEEKNQSNIVNELLREYYSVSGTEEEEIKNSIIDADLAIKKAEADKKLLATRIDKINKAKAELKKKFSNMPEEVLEDFKHYPKMDVETLKVRFDSIYRFKHTGIVWTELLKAWRVWHGK